METKILNKETITFVLRENLDISDQELYDLVELVWNSDDHLEAIQMSNRYILERSFRMNDTYQPVYDAVRSRMSNFNASELIERIVQNFDISCEVEHVKQGYLQASYEQQRPSTLFKPSLSIDGNQWCALYGEDLQCGVAGFGDSPAKAMEDFDKEWVKNITTKRS